MIKIKDGLEDIRDVVKGHTASIENVVISKLEKQEFKTAIGSF